MHANANHNTKSQSNPFHAISPAYPPDSGSTGTSNKQIIVAPTISQHTITIGSIRDSCTNRRFNTGNTAARNAPKSAIPRPNNRPCSNPAINTIPTTTTSPNKTSTGLTLRRSKNGSVNAVKNEIVAIPAKQIEMFATLTAPKKHNQCAPTIAPTPINPNNCLAGGNNF